MAEYRRAYRAKNKSYLKYQDWRSPLAKLKRTASLVARMALSAGLIKKSKTCEHCGCKGKLLLHHNVGYRKCDWLKVITLCSACHVTEHKTFKPKLPRKMYAEFLAKRGN